MQGVFENLDYIYETLVGFINRYCNSSSSATLFQCFFPQTVQQNSILDQPDILKSNSIGFIIPWQAVALSPGISPSTCKEIKQCGQWLRQVFNAGKTSLLHQQQINDSLIVLINIIKRDETI